MRNHSDQNQRGMPQPSAIPQAPRPAGPPPGQAASRAGAQPRRIVTPSQANAGSLMPTPQPNWTSLLGAPADSPRVQRMGVGSAHPGLGALLARRRAFLCVVLAVGSPQRCHASLLADPAHQPGGPANPAAGRRLPRPHPARAPGHAAPAGVIGQRATSVPVVCTTTDEATRMHADGRGPRSGPRPASNERSCRGHDDERNDEDARDRMAGNRKAGARQRATSVPVVGTTTNEVRRSARDRIRTCEALSRRS